MYNICQYAHDIYTYMHRVWIYLCDSRRYLLLFTSLFLQALWGHLALSFPISPHFLSYHPKVSVVERQMEKSFEIGSLCISGWPRSFCVDQDCLKCTEIFLPPPLPLPLPMTPLALSPSPPPPPPPPLLLPRTLLPPLLCLCWFKAFTPSPSWWVRFLMDRAEFSCLMIGKQMKDFSKPHGKRFLIPLAPYSFLL